VHGLLLHRQAASHHNLNLSREQRAEQHLRSIEQRLARLMEGNPAPLTVARDPAQRQVGVCRDFALLHVSMLRHKGIPARMRVGFAKYLDPHGPLWIDHWIVEYWDTGRAKWVLTDPEMDAIYRERLGITGDMNELRPEQDFHLAGSAWRLCRAGRCRADNFRYNAKWRGMPCIRGNLLHDFGALNKIELGVFDYWDDLIRKDDAKLTPDDKALLDRFAELSLDADQNHDAIRQLFDQLPRTGVILSKLSTLGYIGERLTAGPEDLVRSDFERLAERTQPEPPVAQADRAVEKPSRTAHPDFAPDAALSGHTPTQDASVIPCL
jgi:excinuclease ABC subunit A